jgi:hypothetical protein
VCAALAVVFAVRAWEAGAHEVAIHYIAPPGSLAVTLYDGDGTRMRRTVFETAERQHALKLPAGAITAHLSIDGGPSVERAFVIAEDGAIEVRW